jgi:hypothetical protein
MNQITIQKNRYKLISLFDTSSKVGNYEGCLKVFIKNSLIHEKVKFEIFYKLKRLGFEVWGEVLFTNKRRADLIAIKDGIGHIIEVLNSEKEESYNKKLNDYPLEFEMIKVNCNDFKIEDFEI